MSSEEQYREAARKAPDAITLRVCPVCGRNSRSGHLSREHWAKFSDDERCPGVPVGVSYELASWVQWDLKHNPAPRPTPTPEASPSTPTTEG